MYCPNCGKPVEVEAALPTKPAAGKKKSVITACLVLLIIAILVAYAFFDLAKVFVPSEDREVIEEAIEEISDFWEEEYENDNIYRKHAEIKNTRVIWLERDAGSVHEIFKDVKCVVDFTVYSNMYDSAPYYMDSVGVGNSVIFYKDGSCAVAGDIFRTYGSYSYSFDFSNIIDEVNDYGSLYNGEIDV